MLQVVSCTVSPPSQGQKLTLIKGMEQLAYIGHKDDRTHADTHVHRHTHTGIGTRRKNNCVQNFHSNRKRNNYYKHNCATVSTTTTTAATTTTTATARLLFHHVRSVIVTLCHSTENDYRFLGCSFIFRIINTINNRNFYGCIFLQNYNRNGDESNAG